MINIILNGKCSIKIEYNAKPNWTSFVILERKGEYSNPIFSDNITVPYDGVFTIHAINLPTSVTNGIPYYVKDNKFYSATTNECVSTKLIAEVNISEKRSKQLVSICYLYNCYINTCKLIFNSRGFSQCKNNSIDPELIYKRDMLWMTISVINYLTEECQLEEVDRIIDAIHGCNGLCKISNINVTNTCGCAN